MAQINTKFIKDLAITAAKIAASTITNNKLVDVSTATFKGRTTAGTGSPEDLTTTQATALLNNMVGDTGSGGTKGLVPAPGSGDAAANKFLKADGTWTLPTPAVAATPILSRTTTYTASLSDEVIRVSGSAFTLTLPTPVGNTGKKYVIIHNGSTPLNSNYTINPGANNFFVLNSTTASYRLWTPGEMVTFVSDGTNWVRTDSMTNSTWFSPNNLTFTGLGTVATQAVLCQRRGNMLRCKVTATLGTPTAVSFSVTIPNTGGSLSIDTSQTFGTSQMTYGTAYTNITATSVASPATVNGPFSIIIDTADNQSVYLAKNVQTTPGGFVKTLGNAMGASGNFIVLDFEIPITQFNI